MKMADNKVDYIVGADIVFDFENFDGLFQLFEKFFEKCGTKQAFVGFTRRWNDVEKMFREGLKTRGFAIQEATDLAEEFKEANFTILILNKI